MSRSIVRASAAAFTLAAATLASTNARADDTIKSPGDHPSYGVELEPHLLLGWWDNFYPGSAFGIDKGCYLRVAYGALEKETAAAGIGRLARGLKALIKA